MPHIKHFLDVRLPKFLTYFELALKENGDGQGYAVGSSLTFADIALLCFLRGY